jgi:hypothetical protein
MVPVNTRTVLSQFQLAGFAVAWIERTAGWDSVSPPKLMLVAAVHVPGSDALGGGRSRAGITYFSVGRAFIPLINGYWIVID